MNIEKVALDLTEHLVYDGTLSPLYAQAFYDGCVDRLKEATSPEASKNT